MHHPLTRLRRNKKHIWSRELFAEHRLHGSQLICPLFVVAGQNQRMTVPTMPGIEVLSIDLCLELIKKLHDKGIGSVALFPKVDPSLKTAAAEYASAPDNFLCGAIAKIKNAVPDIGVIADIALDPYTDHGHDGLLDASGFVDNDATVEMLCKQALLLAESGCDVLAPSDMMDGRVLAIRELLEKRRLTEVQIFSYSAKYASSLYSPFRDCVGSSQKKAIEKRHYQLSPANVNEALCKAKLDVEEGADAIIVKPASFYLDVVKTIKQSQLMPVIAYQVSGEYAMLKFAALHGALDYVSAQLEALIACKRAGASAIITYSALEIVDYL